MNQLPSPSHPIANLTKCMTLGVKWVPNADDMADLLWLSLQMAQYGPIWATEQPQDAFEPPIDSHNSLTDQAEGTADSSERIDADCGSESISSHEKIQNVPLGIEPTQLLGAETKSPALPIAVPAATALPKALRLGRSLRPFFRKEKSRTRRELDLDATIVQIVDEKLWSPVMQPALGRWLELAIVVEETNLLEVWQDTVVEFQHLMERHGAFRDVKAWQLLQSSGHPIQLFRRNGFVVNWSQPRNPRELHDPKGKRMIIFVSDCTSLGWRSGRIPRLLQQWMTKNPVSVLQLLPERFWERSILGLGSSVWLRSTLPGELNHRLTVEGLLSEQKKPLSSEMSEEQSSKSLSTQSDQLILPIVTLEPAPLLRWAKVIAGLGEQVTAGVVLDLSDLTEYDQEVQQTEDSLTAEQLVQRFRGTASPIAKQLSVMMASVPVSWSIIRLIQKNLLPNKSDTIHIAEIFLSGLLHRVFQTSGTPNQNNLKVRYDFVEGVRELLINSVSRSTTEQSMEFVAQRMFELLPKEVQRRLTEDIERRLGRSTRRFAAFLSPELLTDLILDEEIRTEILPFASITRQILLQLGGEYRNLVEVLDRGEIYAHQENSKQIIQHQTLFSHDRGDVLKRKVAEAYRPRQLLQKADANTRVIQIDASENRIECIYTGYSIVLEETNRLAGTGFDQRMTFDTICPHSKRLGEFSGDLHHIFPAKATVNSARGALPFAELADTEVLEWFWDDGQFTSVPSDHKGEYSRKGSQGFEPRDLAKGIVARALFYIYTIHENQAEASFFESQKDVLRQWHRDYPPSQAELRRSQKIAESEQGNANPFLVDPTLVERIFFTEPEPERQTFQFNIATVMVLSTVEVEIAKIEVGETSTLTPFEFQIATLVEQSPRLWNRNQTYRVQRTPANARQWIEDLGNNITLEMVSIPAGRFEMGAPTTEAQSRDNERPQHPVEINNPFWMGKYPVTQAQWRVLAAMSRINRDLKANPSNFKGDEHPVEQVSWLDAVEFCQRLSVYTGRAYRLPSEAEWEYACRAGTTTPFHFGKSITPDLANYEGNQTYANGPKGKNRGKTTPVGGFGVANDFGLYDMHGNVWEWCEDHWHGSYNDAPKDGRAWLDNDDRSDGTAARLLRGGSWGIIPGNCRSASRGSSYARDEFNIIGFRVVCSAARTS
jgi:formylglycine-generating enzyme required for sulfatase activity